MPGDLQAGSLLYDMLSPKEGQEDRTITKLGGYERNERTIHQAFWIY
ncbi:hypothetical protein H1230_01390 [Paenibacillus sp. 19GGS1-52]|nr:hypothetical protein [Paenibacillus sp. 19GGS1-52]ULO07566.1 hypothetical protein H1230_01390 [Paenibacillus sp. 19GGS1-52]